MTFEEFLTHLEGVQGTGNQRSARCPGHDDHNASLSVSMCSKDGTNRILLNCHAGCIIDDILLNMGLAKADLIINPTPQEDFGSKNSKAQIVARYDYFSENGDFLYRKTKWLKVDGKKTFSWSSKDGQGNWTKGRKGDPILYNLPCIATTTQIFIVEGEKDVETLKAYQVTAVSPPDGAASDWFPIYTQALKGKEIFIIQDNDNPGRKFARTAALALNGQAQSVEVIDLTKEWADLKPHGDITDVLEAENSPESTFARLKALINLTPIFDPLEVTAEEIIPIKFRRMSDIKPIRPEYLIYPYFPKGKLTIVGGVSGSTKTWFILELAALVSKGRKFYTDDEFTPKKEPEVVIYQTKENDYESDVRIRFDKLDANLENIIVIDDNQESSNGYPLTLTDGRIEQAMKQLKPALLIFDPIQSYLGAETDMNQANKVRPIIDKLMNIAATYKCAVVLISHMSKKTDLGALDRLLGSSDLRNAARSILIVGSDPEDPESRIIAHAKNSLGKPGESLKYHIDTEKGVIFDGYSDLEADDIIPRGNKSKLLDGRKNKLSDTLEEAKNSLCEMLGEDGYILKSQVDTYVNMSGIGKSTIYKAKEELCLQNVSIGFNPKVTYWLAPDVDKEKFKLEHTPPPEQIKIS